MKKSLLKDLYKRHILLLSFVFLIHFLLLFQPWSGGGADDIFYYSYLSSFLFDGDIDTTNDCYLSRNSYNTFRDLLARIGPRGLLINQWAIGSSILWFPVYLPVRAVAWILHSVDDTPPLWTNERYSAPYLFTVSFATMLYGLLTLIVIYSTCRYCFRPRIALLAALGAVFASPLMSYIFYFSTMSHAMSAFSVALLFYVTIRYRKFGAMKSYILVAASLALATLVRWQNIIFVIFPAVFWLQYAVRLNARRSKPSHIVSIAAGIIVFAVLVSIQMCYWRAQFGTFFTIPQGREYMLWTAPAIYKVLFSGWHGLYYWHPLLMLATFGIVINLFKSRNRISAFMLFVILGIVIYINATPHDWFAGDSFGARRFSCAIPLFAIGLALFFDIFRRRLIFIPIALTLLAIVLNIVLHVVYTRGIFDIYYMNEIRQLPDDIIRFFPRFIRSIPMSSHIYAALVQYNHLGRGIGCLFIGLLLIIGCAYLVVSRRFKILESNAVVFLGLIIIGILILDCLLLLRPPESDSSNLAFAELMQNGNQLSAVQQVERLEEIIAMNPQNPDIYFIAYEKSGDIERLQRYLEEVKSISPYVWSVWIKSLPGDVIDERLRKEARQYERGYFENSHSFLVVELDKSGRNGNTAKQKVWLKKLLKFNPYHIYALKRIIRVYQTENRESRVEEYQTRLRRFLESRVNNFLSIHQALEPWRYRMLDVFFDSYILELANLYENTGADDRAFALYSLLDRYGYMRPLARRKMFVLRVKEQLKYCNPQEVFDSMNAPDAKEDDFIRAIQCAIAADELIRAIEIIKQGYQRYPDSPGLSHWLKDILKTYETPALPFDLLLSPDIHSSSYRLVIGEFLNISARFADAERLLRDIVSENPDEPWTLYNYGFALFHLGRFDEAEKIFRMSFKIDPQTPSYGVFLARSLFEQGKKEEAFAIISQMLEHNPDDRDITYWKRHFEEEK